jgi:hypothetical protein
MKDWRALYVKMQESATVNSACYLLAGCGEHVGAILCC